jgi:hypothetical protein
MLEKILGNPPCASSPLEPLSLPLEAAWQIVGGTILRVGCTGLAWGTLKPPRRRALPIQASPTGPLLDESARCWQSSIAAFGFLVCNNTALTVIVRY